jgi:thiol-disulfide isomerase/thioredoxin
MSEPRTPFPLSKAAWLLLPVLGLPIGLWVGSLPVPERAPATAAPASAPAQAPGRPLETPDARAPRVEMTVTRVADPGSQASPNAGRPAAPHSEPGAERPERSSWTTMDGALEESRRNGKPVFIDFSADWCGPCQRLKHEVFEDGARAATLQDAVIPVSIVDRRRESGSNPLEIEELQQRYQVAAFPTLVVFSPATGRMVSTRGFRDADETLAWITQAARSVR